MRGAVLYGPRDLRFEERPVPTIIEPTDAIIRISATCVCRSDLWPYRGIQPVAQPTRMGHEYCGIVEEVGRAVIAISRQRATARWMSGARSRRCCARESSSSLLRSAW